MTEIDNNFLEEIRLQWRKSLNRGNTYILTKRIMNLITDFVKEEDKLPVDDKFTLNYADFTGQHLENLDFSGISLEYAVFKDAVISNCNFSHSKINHAVFNNAKIQNCSFNRIEGDYISFKNACLSQTGMTYASLNYSSFTECSMKNINFCGADLSDAKFDKIKGLSMCFMAGSHIDGIIAEKSTVECLRQAVSGCCFTESN